VTSDESGQATVEFALLLPVFALMFLALVQLALIIRVDVLAHDAAREAARAASLGADPGPAAMRVLPGAEVTVSRGDVGDPVRVRVQVRFVTEVALVGALFPDVTIRADAEMRAER